MADKRNHDNTVDHPSGNLLTTAEHQSSWQRLHSRPSDRPVLFISPAAELPPPRSPPIFGSSPRRGHRRGDILGYQPSMAYQDANNLSSSPQSRPITPQSSDGYSGDVDSSPDMMNTDGYFIDDDGTTPRAKKRLTAIKEGSECSDYETAEEKSIENNREMPALPEEIHHDKPKRRTDLRVQTGLPLPDSPGHRRTVSTPTTFEYVCPAVLNAENTNTARPVSVHGTMNSASGCGSSPEHVYFHFGSSEDDEDVQFVKLPVDALRTSPSKYSDLMVSENGPLRSANQSSPTPERSRSSTATPFDTMTDLLHDSPRLHRRPALESLRASTTVQVRPPEEMIRPEADGYFTVFNTIIPNVRTERMIHSFPNVLNDSLNGIAAQAMLNSEKLGVPFMVFKDGRSCMTTGPDGKRAYYTDPYHWKWDILNDIKGIHEFDISHILEANQPRTPTPNQTVSRQLSKAERSELEDLENRSKLGELELVMKPLSRKDAKRLKQLREIKDSQPQVASPTKAGERTSLIHSANDKARKVLGVFTDRSKEKVETETSSIDSKKGDKKAKKKISLFKHGRLNSRSMTDVSKTSEIVTSPARRSMDLLSASEDQTTPRQRNFLGRRRSPVGKANSHESRPSNNNGTESAPARTSGFSKANIGSPQLTSRLTSPFSQNQIVNSSAESVGSSDYNGDESSVHHGRVLNIVPSPERRSADPFAGMGLMEKMEAMKRKREASSAANSVATAQSPAGDVDATSDHMDSLFDPFAGIEDGKSYAGEGKEAEGARVKDVGAQSAFATTPRPLLEGPISRATPLGSNAPTEAEREFARELTRKNKAIREKMRVGGMI